MIKRIVLLLVLPFALMNVASAQTLPGHYPDNGFEDTGWVDAIYLHKGRIVINDMSYTLSESVVVNSLSSANDSIRRLRQGSRIAFKSRHGRRITEIWLLPKNYKPRGRR